jgi:thioredoxin reductase
VVERQAAGAGLQPTHGRRIHRRRGREVRKREPAFAPQRAQSPAHDAVEVPIACRSGTLACVTATLGLTMVRMTETVKVWDCAIVGGGAAGLSAALVLGRARRRVILFDTGEQSNRPAHAIGGLLGYDGRAPGELYAHGRAELAGYPSAELADLRVVSGAAANGRFTLSTADGSTVEAARVLLAPGMSYAVPDLGGVAALWGDTVFHCPYCHGWEVRDRALAVLGATAAMHRALLLRQWSPDVVLLTDGPGALDPDQRAVLDRAGIAIDERRVTGVRDNEGALAAVLFADGSELERDGLLVAAPLRQRSGLAADLGAELTERGTIDVDGFGRTTVAGLYAAGDVSATMQQVAGAIADGARAAAAINDDLLAAEHGVEPMLPARAATPTV